jgi:uncharacterized protein (DUF849 family)
MFLKAAINGGRSRSDCGAVPLSSEEIAQEASRATKLGAAVVHAHARAASGAQSIHPDEIGSMVRAVRALDPSVIIGTTTGLWTCSGHEERMLLVAAWPDDALPDFASVTFAEEGGAEAAQLVIDRGMVLESAVWSMEDVPGLLASPTLTKNVRILIEPEDEDPAEAVATCRQMARAIRAAGVETPLLYHGFDASTWPIVQAAIEDGVETRIGFEDVLVLPDGSIAESNDALIKAVFHLVAVAR